MGAAVATKRSSATRVKSVSVGRDVPRREKGAPEPRTAVRKAPAKKAPPINSAATSRQRRLIAFGGLVGVMTITGALLMVLQPAPLSPDAVKSLMAFETTADVEKLFNTEIPVNQNRWKYIYIHHSGSATGNASIIADAAGSTGALPDHF